MEDLSCHAPGSPAAIREKRLVAITSVAAAILLTGTKLVVGMLTGSLGMLSEAAHSGLDLVAAVVTFLAIRASARPADREHTYGHGKVENLSALFETLLLLATCVWIIWEAVERLTSKQVPVDANVWAFGVMILSIVVDFSRSRALYRVARKYNSQALEADALHFSTDIWSSCVVLGGLGFVLVAKWTGQGWLEKADTVAALGVAGIVVGISYRLGRKTIADLLDEVPPGTRDEVLRALDIPGVLAVRRVRVRRSGPESFVDVSLCTDPANSVERGHQIADAAERGVRQVLPGADVVVHVEPARVPQGPYRASLPALVHATAARLGIGAHAVHVHDVLGKSSVELHLEVSGTLTVAAAHEQASAFEKALREAVPGIERIVTHLEPDGDPPVRPEVNPALEQDVLAILEEVTRAQPGRCLPHDIKVEQVGEDLLISFHCTVDGDLAIAEAHDFTERVESILRSRLRRVSRVVIHVEPPEGKSTPGPA
jgi:cation diffusion facilitator family transporter